MTGTGNEPTSRFLSLRLRKSLRQPSLTVVTLLPTFCAVFLIFSTMRYSLTEPSSHQVVSQLASSPRKGNDPSPPRAFCDSSTIDGPCIFDMGFNRGQSSAFYLRDPAAHVLAIEANPILASKGLQRFSAELAAGRFRLLHLGITNKGITVGLTTFWVNTLDDKFSSFHEQEGCRPRANNFSEPGDHRHCRPIKVPTKTCSNILLEHGTPTYLKVDIEGLDRTCLGSLGELPDARRPQYVSKENVEAADIDLLAQLGYTRFKVVNQQVLHTRYLKDPRMAGTSGHFGEQALDAFLGLEWHTAEQLRLRLPLPDKMPINGNMMFAWYDLHAKL